MRVKPLTATLACYLKGVLTGRGVHVVTVNDYLASRDSEQMSALYGFLGLTTGLIVHGLMIRKGEKPMLQISLTAQTRTTILI